MNHIFFKIILLIFVNFTYTFKMYAQTTFINKSILLPNTIYGSTSGKGISDLNNDGLDDIVKCVFPKAVMQVLYQQVGGGFKADSIGHVDMFPLSITVGDVNNDNLNDIISGGNYDGVTIWLQSPMGRFTKKIVMDPLIVMQAANLVDINNDGLLDYFACNDQGLNQIWKNIQNGNVSNVKDWIDFKTIPASDNSGNYSSVWSDIDNDGDLDLFIGKCSIYAQGTSYLNDPRRINQLFKNNTYSKANNIITKSSIDFTKNPIGWFTESAEEAHVKTAFQSWTCDFADIDNDGDQDLFVTNHEAPSALFLNDGTGHFTDITSQSNLKVMATPWQSIMKDFDNNGYIDIVVSGSAGQAELWLNNGNKTFTKQNEPFGKDLFLSFATGDLNHDGFYDIYFSSDPNYNLQDQMFFNSKNDNNFISLVLKGTDSNKNGIGAKVKVFDENNNVYTREIRAGQGYGVQHSLAEIIGIGTSKKITKIEVIWPSGNQDTYKDVSINQFVYLKEGNCLLANFNDNCSSTIPPITSCNCMNIRVIK